MPDTTCQRVGTHHCCNSRPRAYSLDSPVRYFEPRRFRRGSIRIKRLPADDAEHFAGALQRGGSERTQQDRIIRAAGKLAASRANAKRFLLSVLSNNQFVESEPAPVPKLSRKRKLNPLRPELSEDTHDMRAGIRSSISGPVSGIAAVRPSFQDDSRSPYSGDVLPRTTGTQDSHAIPGPDLNHKPLASANGVSISVNLAEPVLFLQGFDSAEHNERTTAMLRGHLHMRVTKSAKVKAVTLKFKGRALTKWPEGIPPRKVEFEEVDNLMNHIWPFFNAQFPTAEGGTCADHVELFKSTGGQGLGKTPEVSTTNLNSRDHHRKLSLQVNQSRSFGKGETPSGGQSIAQKGYRTFQPGDYIYNFELAIDGRLPETIDVDLGSVKYELEAVVERQGAFRANLIGVKEVELIRAPSEGSLEQVEPIAISRNWEDQLHYDIVISGKSFPLGAKVPIAFKLTPLAKVQCHRIKVLVTENIEYFCSGKRVHRMEPTRKVQLFEKRADAAPTSTFPGSAIRVTAGGGVPFDLRARAAAGEPVPVTDSTNLLGNLEGESNIGPTEMEFEVQLPNCSSNKEMNRSTRLHFDTTYQNIQIHHWIKIVMRLSKPDADNPGKRRHFEISIDSPFHILSCRATQANIALPAYSGSDTPAAPLSLYECGCPNAARRRNSPTTFLPTLSAFNNPNSIANTGVPSPGLARPQAAHIHGANPTTHAPHHQPDRPIHLLRAPSFNPPAFDDEEAPPPAPTPPPEYDTIASPTSGLADYFSRLSDAYEDDSGDEAGRAGRVDVPLTPGARVNRSMDVTRSWVPIGAQVPRVTLPQRYA